MTNDMGVFPNANIVITGTQMMTIDAIVDAEDACERDVV
jgi:hypothetical protein